MKLILNFSVGKTNILKMESYFKQLTPDFSFHVCNHIYQCNKNIAALISPIVAQNILADLFFSEYYLNPSKGDDNYQFEMILNCFYGKPIPAIPKDYFIEMGELLGNTDLIELAINEASQIDLQNIFERLLIRQNNKMDYYEEKIFFAAHFMQLCKKIEEIQKLNPEVFFNILRSGYLRVDNEDTILETILHLGENYLDGLFYIEPQCLSQKYFNIWTELILNLNYSDMSFSNIILFLSNHFKYFDSCIFDKENPLDGLLVKLYKQNIPVTVRVSELGGGDPQKVIRLNEMSDSSDCWTKNLPDSSFTIDFHDKFIKPNYYSIQTYYRGPKWAHLKSWEILGSNDLEKWDLLDRKENINSLNKSFAIVSYPIQVDRLQSYRYLRIKIAGPNHRNNNILDLNRIEFFGSILSS